MFVWSSLEIPTSVYSVTNIVCTAMFPVMESLPDTYCLLIFPVTAFFSCVSCPVPTPSLLPIFFAKLVNDFWSFLGSTGIFKFYLSLIKNL